MSLLARLLAESGGGVPPANPANVANEAPDIRRFAKFATPAVGANDVGDAETADPTPRAEPDTAALRGRLLALAETCGHDVAPVRALAEAELVAWCEFFRALPVERHAEALRVWLDTLRDDAERKAGRVPPDETAAILCRTCGPVFAPPSVAAVLPVVDGWPRALGCPWCFIRAAGGYVPRPSVAAADCAHWTPDPVNPSGGRGACKCGYWWPGERHPCAQWRPLEKTS